MRERKFRVWDIKLNKYVETEFFTGLLDKNGKEIYEGDILKTNECGWIGKVVFNYDGFLLVDNRGGFSSPDWEECEIIGNIHENADLLNE